MDDGSELLEFRKPTGPLLLVSVPLSAITLASFAAPMLASPPRLAASGLLGALTLCFAAMGWPHRRRIIVNRNGTVFDVGTRRTLLQQVTQLCVTTAPGDPSGTFCILASEGGDERVVLFADANPGKVLTVGTRLASSLGLLIDVPLLAISQSFPKCWRVSQSSQPPPLTVFQHVPGLPRPILWLASAGAVFVLSVLASMTHAHWQRHAAFPPASILLAAFLSGIAAWLVHLGLTTRLWHDAEALLSADATDCRSYRCGTWGLFGRRELATWNERELPLGLISAAAEAVWLVFIDGRSGIRSSRISFAGPIAEQLSALTPPTQILSNDNELGAPRAVG